MHVPPRRQPFAIAIAACLALAAFAAYDIHRERSLAVHNMRSSTENLVRLLDEQVRQNLHRIQSALSVAAGRVVRAAPPKPTDAAELRQQLQALLPADGLLRGLEVFDVQGRNLHSTRPDGSAMAEDVVSRDWFTAVRAVAPGQLVIGRLELDRTGLWTLPVALHLRAPEGPFEGVLVALVDMGPIQKVFDALDTGTNGFVTLFLTGGWIVATAPANETLFERNWLDTPMFKQHLPLAAAGTVQQVVVRDNTERIYSYRALSEFPFVVATGVSMTDGLAGWRARVGWHALLLGAACYALLAATFALARHYRRRELAEQAMDEARQKAEESERFLRQLTDNLPLRIAYVDRELRYRFVNEAHCRRFGRPREQVEGRTRQELTNSETAATVILELQHVMRGEARRFEYADHIDGQDRVIESHVVPDIGADGQVIGFYSASSDVTERHQQQRRIELALAERETLLREVYHRVKNNLQVVQSLLSLQQRSLPAGEARAALEDSVMRIRAMALVHEKLYQSGTLSVIKLRDYTQDLLLQIGHAADAARRGVHIVAQVAEGEARLDVAIPYGLLLTELVGNSLKHAFPGERGGRIEVKLLRREATWVLSVSDDGVGVPEGLELASARTMGFQLAASLASQLGGTLELRHGAGAHWVAELPLLG